MSNETPALTADSLSNALWDTLHQVKNGVVHPAQADSVASQAREILRTRRTQMSIQKFAQQSASDDLTKFAGTKSA